MCAISRTYAYLTAYTLTYITENKLWNKCLYLTSSLFFVLFAPGDKISNIFLLSALSFYLPEQIPILLKKKQRHFLAIVYIFVVFLLNIETVTWCSFRGRSLSLVFCPRRVYGIWIGLCTVKCEFSQTSNAGNESS